MIGRPQRKSRSGGLSSRSGEGFPSAQRWLGRLFVMVAFAVLVAAITKEPRRDPLLMEDIDTSKVAEEEIRAGVSFESIDLQATKEARDTAVAKVLDYFRVDHDRVQTQLKVLRDRIDLLNAQRESAKQTIVAALRASTSDQTAADVVAKCLAFLATKLKEDPAWKDMPSVPSIALWLTPDRNSLPERQFTPVAANAKPGAKDDAEKEPRNVEALTPAEPHLTFTYAERLADLTKESIEFVLTQGVRPKELPPDLESKHVVILRDSPRPDQQASSELVYAEVPDPDGALELLNTHLMDAAKRAARDTQDPAEWAKLHEAAFSTVKPLLIDTIRRDNVQTAEARERARDAVAPAMKRIEAGEIIQDRGKRWTAQSRSDVKTYLTLLQQEQKPLQHLLTTALAHGILVALVLFCLFRTMRPMLNPMMEEDEFQTNKNLALLLMCMTVVAGRLLLYFEPSGFMLPVAASGILYAILVNTPLAAMVSALTAVLVSVQHGYDWRLLVTALAMSLAGVFSIIKVRRRSDMAAAALKATFFGLVAMAAISLAMDSLLSESALRRLVLIGLNGLLCVLVVPGVLSPIERLFHITTDIQLLEYSDLNNEVMSRLAIKAPATYAHSLMLGQIAEAAADAIGANGLLARVCAYYHDIGKMIRSEYFTENQQGYNIHDDLTPRMSARAIAAHVIQGAEMAREYHLPRPIIDGILEHHGTCLISFFYQQAVDQQKHGDVREEDFRYPGPKPQSPETAILMICDASESGVRSIKNANAERVREFVDKIIAQRSADRQFDDCNLTLKQLDTIAEVVTQRIVTNLHTRLAYPERKPEHKADNVIALGGME
jgi:hypothetical protein